MGRDVRFSKSLYPSIILDRYRLAFMSIPTVERGPMQPTVDESYFFY
jgi:hypothetical protein